MNQSRGNMDIWVDATHNALAGRCPHCCDFCYVRQMKQPSVRAKYSGAPRIHQKAMDESLGKGKVVFASDCADLFAEAVHKGLRYAILNKYCQFPDNWYHFRTKDPRPYSEGLLEFPPKTILGTSFETTESTAMCDSGISHALKPVQRMSWMTAFLPDHALKMVALEPLFRFDLKLMIQWMQWIKPHFITVGIDSKNTPHPLGEPTAEELSELIRSLHNVCDVILKPNLKRILKDEFAELEHYGYYCNSDLFRECAHYSERDGKQVLQEMNGFKYLDMLWSAKKRSAVSKEAVSGRRNQ